MNNDYQIDQVLNETHAIIEELKNQLAVETTRLSQLEAVLPNPYRDDPSNYATPEWFRE